MNNLRRNLMVGIDDRLTKDPDVIILKSTSTANVLIEFGANTNKMSVHIDDLQSALDEIKNFMIERPIQPTIETPMGIVQVDALQHQMEAIQKTELELGN